MATPTLATLTARVRRAAAWRPPARDTGHAIKVRCPMCLHWRKPREFRRLGRGCRRCIGN